MGFFVQKVACCRTNDVSCVSRNLEGSAWWVHNKSWNCMQKHLKIELFCNQKRKTVKYILERHSHTSSELISMRRCLRLPCLPSSYLHKKNPQSPKKSSYLRVLIKKIHVLSITNGIRKTRRTFSLPRSIVTALYRTWRTAKKNMRMCIWCNPLADIRGSLPYNKQAKRTFDIAMKEIR